MRVFPLFAALLLTACQSVGVQTDFDPSVNFATYRTYQWRPSEAPRGMNPLMFRRIKDSIDRSLTARGYRNGWTISRNSEAKEGSPATGRALINIIRSQVWPHCA